ncbi:hypothetical protein L7F22_034267 [Adiantum nelumboides]|nr:hypothetical protein [Adiantum nelumboides]
MMGVKDVIEVAVIEKNSMTEKLEDEDAVTEEDNLFLGIFVTKMSLFLFYAAAAICKMPRMQDNLWTHVTRNSKYGGSGSGKWTCNFCGETQSGSATRLKAHFSHTRGFGISPCKQVPQDIFNGLKGWKAEQLGLPVEKVPTFKGGECEISRATMKRPRNVQEEVTQESVASALGGSSSAPCVKRTRLPVFQIGDVKADPASEEDDDEVLEDVVVEEVLADEEDILDDDEEA